MARRSKPSRLTRAIRRKPESGYPAGPKWRSTPDGCWEFLHPSRGWTDETAVDHHERPWRPFVVTRHPTSSGDGVRTSEHTNGHYVVSRDELTGPDGAVEMVRLGVQTLELCARHDWRGLQRCKTELCGPEWEGVELYPAESRLLDAGNRYHLLSSHSGCRSASTSPRASSVRCPGVRPNVRSAQGSTTPRPSVSARWRASGSPAEDETTPGRAEADPGAVGTAVANLRGRSLGVPPPRPRMDSRDSRRSGRPAVAAVRRNRGVSRPGRRCGSRVPERALHRSPV